MKRSISMLMMVLMLAVSVPVFSGSAAAQRYDPYYDGSYNQQCDPYYDQNCGKSTYDRHRKAINLTVATAAGAILGAMIGGKKGALIGAAAGIAGGAIVTKKQRPRNYPNYPNY